MSEVYGLTWDCVDFEKKTLTINKNIIKKNQYGLPKRKNITKGHSVGVWYYGDCKNPQSRRTISIGDTLVNALKDYKKEQEENRKFYGDSYLSYAMSREYTLRNCLSSIKDDYDYILLDCQPSLGMLTINALASANSVIIPVQSEYFALRGMTDLFKIINKVRRQINPTLKIEGALLTLVDSRANLPKEIATQLKDNYGSILKLFNTQIPRAVKTAESTLSGGSVFSYDKRGRVANAYSSFAKEVLNNGKEHTKNATAKVR